MTTTPVSTALLLCGALAREVMAIVRKHDWQADCICISAQEHMRPQRIAPLVEQKLRELLPQYGRVIVVYGDCGTGGELDKVLTRYNIPRIAGPHCYEMYGGKTHDVLMEEQPGTFFLTDFLLRGFDGMVWKGLGLDRFPELRDDYFGNYTRLVYLVQIEDPVMLVKAQQVSQKMGLPLEVRHTGYGELENRLALLMNAEGVAPATTFNFQLSSLMASYQILYWRDIPSQVRAGERRERVSVPLSQRFQEAIDAAAMAAGLFGSDDYTNAFTWGELQQRDGTPQEVATAVAAELEQQFEQKI